VRGVQASLEASESERAEPSLRWSPERRQWTLGPDLQIKWSWRKPEPLPPLDPDYDALPWKHHPSSEPPYEQRDPDAPPHKPPWRPSTDPAIWREGTPQDENLVKQGHTLTHRTPNMRAL
jgi:hypothetical protein